MVAQKLAHTNALIRSNALHQRIVIVIRVARLLLLPVAVLQAAHARLVQSSRAHLVSLCVSSGLRFQAILAVDQTLDAVALLLSDCLLHRLVVVRLVFLTHFQLVLVAALCKLHQMR